MARTPNRPAPKSAARDDELRNMLGEADEPIAEEHDDIPIELGQEIETPAARRARTSNKILGLGPGERAFVSVVLFLIVLIFGVALLAATGRLHV